MNTLSNTQRVFRLCATAAFCFAVGQGVSLHAQKKAAYIEATPKAHVEVRGLPIGAVQWQKDGFWGERFQMAMENMVPAEYEYFMKQSEDNFRKVAGDMEPDFGTFGTNWQDGDYYKWLEAQVAYYAVHPSPELLKKINDCATLIARAQDEDGYITTHVQMGYGLQGPSQFKTRKVVHDKPHFTVRGYHETYNIGHLMTLAATHYRVTGSRILLDVAIKAGNCLDKAYKKVTPKLAEADFNPTQIMGLVEIYRCTGNKRFLNLANRFVSGRGYAKTEFSQNATPFREERDAVGHAVTGTVLYNGAADLYAETGDSTLLTPLKAIWDDIYTRKASLTGGLGSEHNEIDHKHMDKTVHEAFGHAYDIHNATAYNETCAALYGAYFSWRMFMITGDSKYVDQMEVAFYNDLSATALDGKSYFYTNPLRWHGQDHELLSLDHHKRWTTEVSCVCCPTSMVRFLTETNNYAYAVNKNALFVTLYGSNSIQTKVGGQDVAFKQETNYPWNGQINMTYEADKPANFALKLRIPHWAKKAKVVINGKAKPTKAGTFATVKRQWKKGDKVELQLNMKPRLVQANGRVEQLVNQVAIVNGPIVYCAETVDYIAPFVDFNDMMIAAKPKLKVEYKPQLLGGINSIKVPTMYYRTETFDSDALYSTDPMKVRQTQMTFIPYYAWNNRGTSRMSVFFPIKW